MLYAYICCDCRKSMVSPLPQLVAKNHHRVLLFITIIIIIINIFAWVGHSSRTVQLLRVISHLQLEILGHPHKLLMLLDSGLRFKKGRIGD